jgi:hypothetical protein
MNTAYFPEIHYNIIILYMPKSWTWSLPLQFSGWYFYVFLIVPLHTYTISSFLPKYPSKFEVLCDISQWMVVTLSEAPELGDYFLLPVHDCLFSMSASTHLSGGLLLDLKPCQWTISSRDEPPFSSYLQHYWANVTFVVRRAVCCNVHVHTFTVDINMGPWFDDSSLNEPR